MPKIRSRRRRRSTKNAKTMDVEDPDTYGFKGKVPTVVLERLDIAPRTNISSSERTISLIEKYPDFLFKSQVSLVRCDLEKLKETHEISATFKFRCTICDKRYPDEKKLRNHHDNEHLIVYGPFIIKPQKRVSFSDHTLVHEYHKCRKCTMIFESYHLLKEHIKENHIIRKYYICDYCTMSFIDRTIFKVHIKLHCDVCHRLLPNTYQYEVHRKLVCNKTKKSFQIIKKNLDLSEPNNHLPSVSPGCSSNLLEPNKSDVKEDSIACKQCAELFGRKCTFLKNNAIINLRIGPDDLLKDVKLGHDCVYVCLVCVKHFVDK